MAERRMFTQKITESDAFLDMPSSSQNLYFHLCMYADDDGFVNAPRKIQRYIGATDDDAKILISKSFIIPFESGVIVIKHWRLHNQLRKDRYHPTAYFEEKQQLYLKSDGTYTLDSEQGTQFSLSNEGDREYESIGEYSIGKESIGKDRLEEKKYNKEKNENLATKWQPNGNQPYMKDEDQTFPSRFTPPTIEQIRNACLGNAPDIDPEQFYYFYQAKGWKVGGDYIFDWVAKLKQWQMRKMATTVEQDRYKNKDIKNGGTHFEQERVFDEQEKKEILKGDDLDDILGRI